MKLVAVCLAAVILGAWVTSWSSASGPDRITRLERKVAAQGKTIRVLQMRQAYVAENEAWLRQHQETAAEANDRQQTMLDLTNAGVACLASWVGSVDDLGACHLLGLKVSPPDYFALNAALAKAAGH